MIWGSAWPLVLGLVLLRRPLYSEWAGWHVVGDGDAAGSVLGRSGRFGGGRAWGWGFCGSLGRLGSLPAYPNSFHFISFHLTLFIHEKKPFSN